MGELFPPSLDDMIACAERELAYRRRVYPRRREAGQMTQALSDREMARMEAILKLLTRLRVTASLQAMVDLQTAARRVVWAWHHAQDLLGPDEPFGPDSLVATMCHGAALLELENIVGRPLRERDI